MNEDCFFLNVLTPNVGRDVRRPVMVWIHGGGLQGGSGDGWPFLNGAFPPEDVVLVTINYRPNVFGFLHLDERFDSLDGSGCLGDLDQVAALEWVAGNISGFGGDPANITVFGESAATGASRTPRDAEGPGLFRSAIVQSGGADVVADSRRPGRPHTMYCPRSA
jgi:para-nitrobenzyl esterase